MHTLLAIDLGVKTGFALYNRRGNILRYHSQNFGNARRLKKAVYDILHASGDLQYLYLEGGGKLEKYWIKEAAKMGVHTIQLHADEWRQMLYPAARHHHKTRQSKQFAEKKARELLQSQSLPLPHTLNHDVAEAILVGLYGCIAQGWLPKTVIV